MTIILDPGHGLSNKRSGVFDPGACANGLREADIALAWANELRGILIGKNHVVVRTRKDNKDPAPIGTRDDVARRYFGDVMLSIHCNAADGKANGTEVFYRGKDHLETAQEICDAVCANIGTRNRGAKTESQSQHKSLAVMAFQPTYLLEIGFIDHIPDAEKMVNAALRKAACEAIASILLKTSSIG
jgi:N-acetylmuramoyl-L-alanine amidase